MKGTVKLVFQPAEEGMGGAYHMIKEGALDDIQSMFGMHVWPGMSVGTIASKPGPLLAGSNRFSAVIQGKGGHAAAPHKTRDPVLALSMAILALQQLVSRETDPLEARVFYPFHMQYLVNSDSVIPYIHSVSNGKGLMGVILTLWFMNI